MPSGRSLAIGLSVVAAFGWATYYLFVLWVTPGTSPSATLVYPFVGGALGWGVWAVLRSEGRALRREFLDVRGYLRAGLLVGMQASVLASTYLTGPVDASLLSLIGDLVATPLLVAWWVAERRRQVTSALFAFGLLLSVVGGGLAIAGGHSLEAVPPAGWLAVPAVPLAVALYFVVSARDASKVGLSAAVGQSIVCAGGLAALFAPLVPGGWGGLVRVGSLPLLLLLVNGLVSFFLAPLCYFTAIARAGLLLPPTLMTGIPVFTLLLTAAVLGIVPPSVALLGVPVAVAGGLVALRAERPVPDRAATASP